MRAIKGQGKIGRRASFVAVATVLLLVSGAFGLVRLTSRELRRRYVAPGRMVSIGGGQRLHLYCAGKGAPTIIVESGLGTDWVSWHVAMPDLAAHNLVCVYDRAGYGWSEPGPKPRTASRLALELHLLLTNAAVPGPYLLVAHSFGAYIARVFAARFPGSLCGLVLVDPSHEDEPRIHTPERRLRALLPPIGLQGILHLCEGERALPANLRYLPPAYRNRFLVDGSYDESVAARAEDDASPESEAEARAASLPRDLPLTVITATYIVTTNHPGAPEMEVKPRHIELQAQLARLSSRGRQIIAAKSGHDIQVDRPELIVQAVRETVQGFCHPAFRLAGDQEEAAERR